MPKFEFRLQVALNIAERSLEDEQKKLAVAVNSLRELQEQYRIQEVAWKGALDIQLESMFTHTQDLVLCREFSQQQLDLLRSIASMIKLQEDAVLNQRNCVLEAYKVAEKLHKLKAKQLEKFNLEQNRREQSVLDETGQVVFRRNQNLAKSSSQN